MAMLTVKIVEEKEGKWNENRKQKDKKKPRTRR
jgi:hypothetical protein